MRRGAPSGSQNQRAKKLKSRKPRELPRKMNIEEVEAPKHQKITSFITKTPLRTVPEQRKVRELPGKMYIEEVEEPKKCENFHADHPTVSRRMCCISACSTLRLARYSARVFSMLTRTEGTCASKNCHTKNSRWPSHCKWAGEYHFVYLAS